MDIPNAQGDLGLMDANRQVREANARRAAQAQENARIAAARNRNQQKAAAARRAAAKRAAAARTAKQKAGVARRSAEGEGRDTAGERSAGMGGGRGGFAGPDRW
tara:strand:- start:655 stop:966 length:312 start_codon:yes stop_codon:yes gene_type:complete